MNLTPREKDKLLISVAAMVARRRLERGVKLNHPEAIALITDFILEGARDGKTVAELMQTGAQGLTRAQGMDGIPAMIHDVQGEAGAVAEKDQRVLRGKSRYGEANDPRRILHQGRRDRAQRRPQDRDDERH